MIYNNLRNFIQSAKQILDLKTTSVNTAYEVVTEDYKLEDYCYLQEDLFSIKSYSQGKLKEELKKLGFNLKFEDHLDVQYFSFSAWQFDGKEIICADSKDFVEYYSADCPKIVKLNDEYTIGYSNENGWYYLLRTQNEVK